ncbi:MAG: M20/M25/M40 family metallo-hydrolase [Bacillati bacterium ANGP1]|uniref:M20/M25/M40 family metallo-hydrolase n=1 Tax=Candidatus Segetimicrobium genomatis TaxID=2569760 RepID=A0A537JNA3_9BACT|nr:MAG: M20/M25/M40 family metallo-hydrolase [Terrabacteria group bacterium ANGP1]
MSAIGRTGEGGVTRLSYRAEHADAARVSARWMHEAGAEVGVDSWGNLFGIVPGSTPGLPPLAAGSHLDTVPNGGIFDGALGVVAAIEAAAALREARAPLRHPLLLLAFAEEEGTSFGVGCLGSQGAAGRALSRAPHRAGTGAGAPGRAARGGRCDRGDRPHIVRLSR